MYDVHIPIIFGGGGGGCTLALNVRAYTDCDRIQDILSNKSSLWLDWIELKTQLILFEIFVSSLIHDKSI